MELINRDTFLKNMRPVIASEKDGSIMIDRISFNSPPGRWYNLRAVKKDGMRKDKPIYVRLYNAFEIRSLVRDPGLEIEAFCGGWNSEPVSTEAGKMVIVARKSGDLDQKKEL